MSKTNKVAVAGNTYPVKELLKQQCAARWNSQDKCWMVPVEFAQLAAEIVASAPRANKVVPGSRAVSADTKIVWSDEQSSIVDWFKSGTKNLVVRARAGTGKTFTIIGGATAAPESRIGYLVFNKKNQVEASEKIADARITVITLHSAGFRCIKRVWPKAKPDDQVEWDRIDSVAGQVPNEVAGELFKLVGFAKNIFVNVPSLDEMVSLADARLIECENFEQPEDGGWTVARLSEVAIEVLELSKSPDSINRISFNDMVWLPVAMKWVQQTFDLVIVDEAQDMNAPQLLMARQLTAGRMAVVGDDRQAIYEFRGAVSNGIDMMKRELNADELGLTVTRRCGKDIVAEAVQLVPDYKSAPDAHQGLVDDISDQALFDSARPSDAILSRINAPLMSICLSFIRKGVACRIEGRDVGASLLSIIRKLKARSIPEVVRKAEAWGQRMIARAGNSEKAENKIQLINDQVQTIVALVEGLGSVSEIEARVHAIFSDSTDRSNQGSTAIVCSTVHKAKGLEWNRVFILGATFKRSGGQEDNVYYVAQTRAKKHLTYVGGRRNLSGR